MSDTFSDTLRKIGLFGIGVIALTQERLEEFTGEMVKKGEMNKEEGKKFVREVLFEKDRQLKEIEAKIGQTVKDAVEISGIATKRDIEALRKRLERLERNTKIEGITLEE